MKSGPIRMKRLHCYMLMLLHQAPIVALIMAAVITALTVAGFLLSPWIGIAALGIDVFVLVLGMSFVLFAYGFNSITGVNMPAHILEVEEDAVIVELEDGKRIPISRRDFKPYRIYPGGVLVPVEGRQAGWIWIPPKAFHNDEDFKTFLKLIYEGNSK